MNIDNKYIVNGITINKTKDGYKVFTIPTQHFNITSLDDLTNERFEQEIERQLKYEKDSSELIKLWLYDNTNLIEEEFNNKNNQFKDRWKN